VSERLENAELLLDQLQFGDYWPPGSPEIVREFLIRNYDPETMPKLHVATLEGKEGYWLIGWDSEPGLLEAARGYPLTENEERWARMDTSAFGIGGE